MPHLMIASDQVGKSVCINCLIISLLYKARPDGAPHHGGSQGGQLSVYWDPHLLIPVVTDPKKAAGALNCCAK